MAKQKRGLAETKNVLEGTQNVEDGFKMLQKVLSGSPWYSLFVYCFFMCPGPSSPADVKNKCFEMPQAKLRFVWLVIR